MGCNGGQPSSAWRWFTTEGVVTGGDYSDVGKGTTCKVMIGRNILSHKYRVQDKGLRYFLHHIIP